MTEIVEHLSDMERRQHPREAPDQQRATKLEFLIQPREAATPSPLPITSLLDMSLGGLRFSSEQPLASGTMVQLRYSPRSRERHLVVTGQVIWAAGPVHSAYQHGVRFDPGDEDAAAELLEELLWRQLWWQLWRQRLWPFGRSDEDAG